MEARIFRGSKMYPLSKIITLLQAKKELIKGSEIYLVHMTLRKWARKEVEGILVVR